MKPISIILVSLFCLSCSNNQANSSETQTVETPTTIEKEPLSYDELKAEMGDSGSKISDIQMEEFYKKICPSCKVKSGMEFKELKLEDLSKSYGELKALCQMYQDSGIQYLKPFETFLAGLESKTETINSETPIDLNKKLEISEIKSDIHQLLSVIRLKKIK